MILNNIGSNSLILHITQSYSNYIDCPKNVILTSWFMHIRMQIMISILQWLLYFLILFWSIAESPLKKKMPLTCWKSLGSRSVNVPSLHLSVCSSLILFDLQNLFFKFLHCMWPLFDMLFWVMQKANLLFLSLWKISTKIKFVFQCSSFVFLDLFLNISLKFPLGMDHHLTLFSLLFYVLLTAFPL